MSCWPSSATCTIGLGHANYITLDGQVVGTTPDDRPARATDSLRAVANVRAGELNHSTAEGTLIGEARRSRWWLIVAGVTAVPATVAVVWWFCPGPQQVRRNAALVGAARAGDVKAVEAALDAGADVNARDGDGITSLMHAARGDRPEIAHPGPTDRPEVVELLLKRGADVNATTGNGFVALFWAARYGHAGAARVLVAHGADVNAKDKDGMTALKWATTNRHGKVVELLREAGARE